MLEFRILGPLEVLGEGGPVRLGGPRQRATLAILLLNANRVVPIDKLADELYAGRPPVTAVTQIHRQVSELRKALGADAAIETRAPGYVVRVREDSFDLARFERLAGDAERARARGDFEGAAGLLRDALALWRGPALADLVYESFARAAVERLEELRLAVLEDRIELDLALGRHALIVSELVELIAEHPLRERLHAHRMLALYRAGRQAEALDAYRDARRTLVENVGIEPSQMLRQLERAILAQDPSLDATVPEPAAPHHVVVAAVKGEPHAAAAVALPLARHGADVVAVRLLETEDAVASAATEVAEAFGSHARTAAFTSDEYAADVVRLASANDAELVLVDAPFEEVGALLERSPADVAVLAGGMAEPSRGVYVPFGGGEHEWAALELGAWLAAAAGAPLRLVGTKSDTRGTRRDASRLLAEASLAVQRAIGVPAAPVLADPEAGALIAAVADAGVVVVGISPRWRDEGIGSARSALVRAGLPTLVVHRGPRPGALAPREARTRFTWTIDA